MGGGQTRDRLGCLLALVLAVAPALVGCADRTVAARPGSEPTHDVIGNRTGTNTGTADRARDLLDAVRRVEQRPDVPGYDRSCSPGAGCVFGTDWSDDTDAPLGHNGCDTRNDVLGRSLEAVVFSERSNGCDVVAGLLLDPYTGETLDYAIDGSRIHIDHLFPLAAAWDLGAAEWSPERRARFANDPDLELLAVSGSANLAKGDSTPASWLPPDLSFRCAYVTSYLEVALAYGLAVTDADVRVMEPAIRKSC